MNQLQMHFGSFRTFTTSCQNNKMEEAWQCFPSHRNGTRGHVVPFLASEAGLHPGQHVLVNGGARVAYQDARFIFRRLCDKASRSLIGDVGERTVPQPSTQPAPTRSARPPFDHSSGCSQHRNGSARRAQGRLCRHKTDPSASDRPHRVPPEVEQTSCSAPDSKPPSPSPQSVRLKLRPYRRLARSPLQNDCRPVPQSAGLFQSTPSRSTSARYIAPSRSATAPNCETAEAARPRQPAIQSPGPGLRRRPAHPCCRPELCLAKMSSARNRARSLTVKTALGSCASPKFNGVPR